ncbi:MAG TPA: hypothetical protein VFG83_03435 [Kofleriaceae bacterium]|nr:hypothetical protein [Kofleriaceae bacterium]
MDRLACVDVPALAERALMAADIRRIDPERAAQMLADIDADTQRLTERLRQFSPDVDPHAEGAGSSPDGSLGLFWLSAQGLDKLFPDREKWALAIQRAIAEAGFSASVVVGHGRFTTAALARESPGSIRVLTDLEAERKQAAKVPLARIAIDPEVRDFLAKLGITTLGSLAKLPPGGLLTRFGKSAHAVQELCAGRTFSPLRPIPVARRYRAHIDFDDPEDISERLVFAVKTLLAPLMAEILAAGARVTELVCTFAQNGGDVRTDRIRPADPTRDDRALLRLVHLRLEAQPLCAAARALDVELLTTAADARQLSLIAKRPRRDPRDQRRAFARLRAEFGNTAVVRAHLSDGHLPEAQFHWDATSPRDARQKHISPKVPEGEGLRSIRRIYSRPQPLAGAKTGDHIAAGDWLGENLGRAVQIFGPYVVCGGWWQKAVDRAYYFVRAERGDWLWIYRDRRRRRWLIHGKVE